MDEPLSTAPEADANVGSRIGRYEIEAVLGSGAMGIVYRARDVELDRPVALKLLLPRGISIEESRARLRRESQAMARLDHPAVVRVYDVGVDGDQLFVAMELVPGGTLREWMQSQHPWREVISIFVQAGAGLAAAHAAGLVHRDFKPANVLVDAAGGPRVSDFGLARTFDVADVTEEGASASSPASAGATPFDAKLTVTGHVLGTPAYMAPEQMQSAPVDARADQFAFCVALWEALYGERPFRAAPSPAIDELLEATMAGRFKPAPPDSRVPTRVRETLTRGLAADPDRRWPSMTSLLAALDAARWRRKVPVIVGGLVAIGLAGGVALLVALGGRHSDGRASGDARASTPAPAATTQALGQAMTVASSRSGTFLPRFSFAPDGLRLLSTEGGAVSIVPVHEGDGDRVPIPLPASIHPVVAYRSRVSGWLIVGSFDGNDCPWWHVPIDGSTQPQLLASKCADRIIDVASDGRHAALAEGARVLVRDLDHGTEKVLTQLPGGDVAADVTWSPDGTRVAFMTGRSGVSVVDVQSGSVLATRQPGEAPSWIDNHRLAYSDFGWAQSKVRALDLSHLSQPTPDPVLATVEGHIDSIDTGRDGLIVTTSSYVRTPYETEIRTAIPRRLNELRSLESGGTDDVIVVGWTAEGDVVTVSHFGAKREFVRITPGHRGEIIKEMPATFVIGGTTGTQIVYAREAANKSWEIHSFNTATNADDVWQKFADVSDSWMVRCAALRPVCIAWAGSKARSIDASTTVLIRGTQRRGLLRGARSLGARARCWRAARRSLDLATCSRVASSAFTAS